jgi:hypothetical protein
MKNEAKKNGKNEKKNEMNEGSGNEESKRM